MKESLPDIVLKSLSVPVFSLPFFSRKRPILFHLDTGRIKAARELFSSAIILKSNVKKSRRKLYI